MNTPPGDRITELEARLRAASDTVAQDRIRVLLALEHLTHEVERVDERERELSRELSGRSAVIQSYQDWRQDVERQIREFSVELARLQDRCPTREAIVLAAENAQSRPREWSPLVQKSLAIAAALLALAFVLALGGGDVLRSLLP